MPAKNSRKIYIENGYYHVYNRGVEKRIIFLDQQDYSVFLKYLKEYLQAKNESELRQKLSDPALSYEEKEKLLSILRLNNFNGRIKLVAFCLMPNHFHFLIKQKNATDMDKFMNSLCTRYSMYFNRKYKRVGPLLQGVYKAVLVTSNEQYLYLTKYIHKQALIKKGESLQNRYPSSYDNYIGKTKSDWIFPEEVLSYFNQNKPGFSYESFVLSEEILLPQNILLEENQKASP